MNPNSTYIKYPRTKHVPWSPGASEDDIILDTVSHFSGKEVVVSTKMDGESCTMYSDHIHARSINSGYHPSRTWVKKLHASISHEIPNNVRICGENLFATHSIHYENLPSYFLVFSVWEDNTCLSWNDTLAFCDMLNLRTVPVLYRGLWNEDVVRACYQENGSYGLMEGYVVRVAESFKFEDFGTSVAKFVGNKFREELFNSDEHWMHRKVIQNKLKDM